MLSELPKALQESKGRPPPGLTAEARVPVLGLDPGIVAAAKAQGVPEEQIRKIGALLKKPNRMTEEWRGGTAPRRSADLSESEDEEAEEAEEIAGEEPKGAVEKAVVQLTKLVKVVTKT